MAILANSIPFESAFLYYASIVFFILNVPLFALALCISILRYTLYPEIWSVMVRDPTNSLFLATCPMGFATLIEMWVLVCVPVWGEWARTFAWVLWIVDVVAAALATISLSFILFVFVELFPGGFVANGPQHVPKLHYFTGAHHGFTVVAYGCYDCCGWYRSADC